MTDKQAPESRGTEVSDDELRSIIVRACNINAIDVTPAEMQFARDLARALLATQRSTEPAVRGDAEALRDAAQALVDRWDTPLWKDVEHTGRFIDRLRAALAQTPEGKDEPCPNP